MSNQIVLEEDKVIGFIRPNGDYVSIQHHDGDVNDAKQLLKVYILFYWNEGTKEDKNILYEIIDKINSKDGLKSLITLIDIKMKKCGIEKHFITYNSPLYVNRHKD
jgi:hypothetical protein